MKRLGSALLVLVLCVSLVLGLGIYTAAGGGMTGYTYVGVRYEDGELFYSPGATLDYEFGKSDVHLTFDVSIYYDLQKLLKDQTFRYDVSLNWYPDVSLLRGFALTVGGVYARERLQPVWYLEVARPFQ